MTDEYLTVKEYATARFKEKGSKFIGHIYPVNSRDDAAQRLSEVKQEYYDATHNCSAYVIGLGDETDFHYDDDGEPSGTAGKPIYQAITGADLTNVIIIITRYFGGTKLGTGGLIRAYGESAHLTIENATIVRKVLTETVSLETTYEDISAVMRTIENMEARITDQDYGEKIRITVAVRQSLAEQFRRQLIDSTGDRIAFV
ncbi:MAG: YigZ family protein [Candidatus Marinimicrobia bacterium]|nr:YigZ family protein [Candidatus Neomarinimicrobiota bacterium]MCF7827731.1 YigZ family protein [Candidatus Neomarinimicrobiota bacterium]MCF7881214.1 YigZ family protein [Candidatus Neomarinimicrobiota bacterium]